MEQAMMVSATVAVYPLRQPDYRAIEDAIEVLTHSGLSADVQPMHTELTESSTRSSRRFDKPSSLRLAWGRGHDAHAHQCLHANATAGVIARSLLCRCAFGLRAIGFGCGGAIAWISSSE
jgi:hypothetical protein